MLYALYLILYIFIYSYCILYIACLLLSFIYIDNAVTEEIILILQTENLSNITYYQLPTLLFHYFTVVSM